MVDKTCSESSFYSLIRMISISINANGLQDHNVDFTVNHVLMVCWIRVQSRATVKNVNQ